MGEKKGGWSKGPLKDSREGGLRESVVVYQVSAGEKNVKKAKFLYQSFHSLLAKVGKGHSNCLGVDTHFLQMRPSWKEKGGWNTKTNNCLRGALPSV